MIKTFVQGDVETDDRLYCLIGKFALNPKIHQELGVPLTGIEGDVWYLHFDSENKADGFCQVRINKNTQWHIRFLHADEKGVKVRNDLLKRAIADAKQSQAPLIFTNDRETAGIWNLFNFVPGEKKRGTFIRWEKKL